MTTVESNAPVASRRNWATRRRPAFTPWLFLAPSLILVAVFAYYPLLEAVRLSFTSTTALGDGGFVGGENYAEMISRPLFWTSLRNTLVLTVATVPIGIAIGLTLAVALNRRLPWVGFIRTLYFLPFVVSGVAASLIMGWIFNADLGIANGLLGLVGISPVAWLDDPSWAMFTLVGVMLWGRFGFCLVIYLAALQSIPASLMEAAQMDGATSWRRFRSVTWPLLAPTTFLLLILNVVHTLQSFDIIYVLTGGGPGYATTVFIQYIFNSAFADGRIGFASAMGVVFIVILLIFTYWRYYGERRLEDR